MANLPSLALNSLVPLLSSFTSTSVKDGEKSKKEQRRNSLLTLAALVVFLGAIHLNVVVLFVVAINIRRVWALTLLALWITLAFLPIYEDNSVAKAVSRFICKYVIDYFPITFVMEDESLFDSKQAYVIGVEPHSVFPIGLIAFSKAARKLPLSGHALASTAVFCIPILRHIWGWLGLAPANRKSFVHALKENKTVALVPGGVQECLYMRPNEEVVYLKKRYGFVRLAIQGGAPLVPSFIFGQSAAYSWWMPSGKWYTKLSRKIGFAPLLFWGPWWTPLPYDAPMLAVVGKPIPVEKIAHPTHEQVEETLAKFIKAMEDLFYRHKAAAGYPYLKLRVI